MNKIINLNKFIERLQGMHDDDDGGGSGGHCRYYILLCLN
jgi:hypothetical protein